MRVIQPILLAGTTLAADQLYGGSKAGYSKTCVPVRLHRSQILRCGVRHTAFHAAHGATTPQGRHEHWSEPRGSRGGPDKTRLHRENVRLPQGSARGQVLAQAARCVSTASISLRDSAPRGV